VKTPRAAPLCCRNALDRFHAEGGKDQPREAEPVIAAAAKAIHGRRRAKAEQAHGFDRRQAMATGIRQSGDGLDEEKARRDKSQSESVRQRASARPVAAQVKESDESGQLRCKLTPPQRQAMPCGPRGPVVAEGKILRRELQGRDSCGSQGEAEGANEQGEQAS